MALNQTISNWVTQIRGRTIVLLLAAFLSLPNLFSPKPGLGLDNAWAHSIQNAATSGQVFGRDILFTYGPLGYLFTRSPVNKLNLLLLDLFVLSSLLSIYRKLLPDAMPPGRAVLVLAVALTTKYVLAFGPAAVLFIIAGYWLWLLHASDRFLVPLAGSLTASVLLFFSKVNFGLVMVGLVPCYAVGLLICRRDWKRALWLAGGFVMLILLGAAHWHVAPAGYLKASLEFVAGYDEAMSLPLPAHRVDFLAAGLLAMAVATGSVFSFKTRIWRDWLMICPFVLVATVLFFKNAFVRADDCHTTTFFTTLPLLVSVWYVAVGNARIFKLLLPLSLCCAVVQLELQGYSLGWFSWTPLRYAHGVVATPWTQNGQQLGDRLRAGWPDLVIPEKVRATIGRSSVDVLPWDTSLALLNGLQLKERPVIQTYAAFTPWLDTQNARFFSSSAASDFLLYVVTSSNHIDSRISAWDESITKRALIENFTPVTEFQMKNRPSEEVASEAELVVVLKRVPNARKYEPISTNKVELALGQTLGLPATTNFQFLSLDVERTFGGKLVAGAAQPCELTATFAYSDGTSKDYRAVLPILRTGVLVNYRVESAEEIRRWLYSDMAGNVTTRSVCFKSPSAWAFSGPFRGELVTCRLVSGPLFGPSQPAKL